MSTREEYNAKYKGKEHIESKTHPNCMKYYDGNDVKHEIYIPARDYYKANNHLINKEWDELAKFPKYSVWEQLYYFRYYLTWLAGQGYTEADYFTDETDPKTFYSVQPPPDIEEPEEELPTTVKTCEPTTTPDTKGGEDILVFFEDGSQLGDVLTILEPYSGEYNQVASRDLTSYIWVPSADPDTVQRLKDSPYVSAVHPDESDGDGADRF